MDFGFGFRVWVDIGFGYIFWECLLFAGAISAKRRWDEILLSGETGSEGPAALAPSSSSVPWTPPQQPESADSWCAPPLPALQPEGSQVMDGRKEPL